MKRKPQDIREAGILSHEMIGFLILVVGILSILTVSLYSYFLMIDMPLVELRSAMFLAIPLIHYSLLLLSVLCLYQSGRFHI